MLTPLRNLLIICLLLHTCAVLANDVQPNYPVGVTYFNAIDYSRPEKLTDNPRDYRDVMIKIWYPAQDVTGYTQSYLHRHTKRFPYPKHQLTPADQQFHQYLQTFKTAAHLNPPLATRNLPFPIIMYSHGYQSLIEDKEFLMIRLAQQGYIVVSVGHAHQAQFIGQAHQGYAAFDQEKRANDWFLSDLADMSLTEWITEFNGYAGQSLTAAEQMRVRHLLNLAEGDRRSLATWIQDMHFAFDQLRSLHYGTNKPWFYTKPVLTQFAGQLDLNRVAAAGLSFGGPTAVSFCHQLYVCRAAVNLDASHYNLSYGSPSQKPYLMMQADEPLKADFKIVLEQQQADTYILKIAGAKHFDFSDSPIIFPNQRGQGFFGTIDPYRVVDLVDTAIIDFMNVYLTSVRDKTD